MASNQFPNTNGLEDYAAHVYESGNHGSTCYIAQCKSPEDAARSYMANVIEDHSGLFRELAIRVWPLNMGPEESTIFDASAKIEPYSGEDAEEGEYEATIKLQKWSKTIC